MKNKTEHLAFPVNDGRLRSVGIIMDGNGRWAKKRGLPRTAGHVAGAKIIERVLADFRELGVHCVTLYAFSTENWKRPKDEVDALMALALKYIDVVIEKINKNPDFSVRFIGDKSPLPEALRKRCIEVENMAKNTPFVCNVALNYGGRDEIVHAVNEALAEGRSEITADDISAHLYTAGTPEPDLIIRTGGDLRLSNFLLWQSAYSEIYVTDTLWPDFDRAEIIRAAESFLSRKRRFGGLDSEEDKK